MGKNSFLKGALIGALIGTAAALLTTKKTGKERQAELKKMHPELFEAIVKEVEKVKAMSKTKYDELVEKAVRKYGKNRKMAESQIKEAIMNLKGKWVEIKKHMK